MATYSNVAFNNKKADEYDYKVLPARMVSLGRAASASVEKDLYKFYFRTSKFDNLSDKLASLTWQDAKYALPGMLEDVIHNAVNPVEGFDVFEIEGYRRQASSNNFDTLQVNHMVLRPLNT
jgi:hypothetical protein